MTLRIDGSAQLPTIPAELDGLSSAKQWEHYVSGSLAFIIAAQRIGIPIERREPLLSTLDDIDAALGNGICEHLPNAERDDLLGYLEQLTALEDTKGVGDRNADAGLYVTYNAAGRLSLRSDKNASVAAEASRQ